MNKKILLFILLPFQTIGLSAMDSEMPSVTKITDSSGTNSSDYEPDQQKNAWEHAFAKKQRSHSISLSSSEEEEDGEKLEILSTWEQLEVPIKTDAQRPTEQLKTQQKQSKNIGCKLINLLTKQKNHGKKNQQQRSKAIIAELTDPKTALPNTSSDEDSSSDNND